MLRQLYKCRAPPLVPWPKFIEGIHHLPDNCWHCHMTTVVPPSPRHPVCGWATLESHLAIRIVNLPNEFASQVAPRGIPRIESPQVEIVLTASEAIIVAIYLCMYVYQL